MAAALRLRDTFHGKHHFDKRDNLEDTLFWLPTRAPVRNGKG